MKKSTVVLGDTGLFLALVLLVINIRIGIFDRPSLAIVYVGTLGLLAYNWLLTVRRGHRAFLALIALVDTLLTVGLISSHVSEVVAWIVSILCISAALVVAYIYRDLVLR